MPPPASDSRSRSPVTGIIRHPRPRGCNGFVKCPPSPGPRSGGERNASRALCVNLIQGAIRDVVASLNDLTCGDGMTPQARETRDQWRDTLERMSDWHPKG